MIGKICYLYSYTYLFYRVVLVLFFHQFEIIRDIICNRWGRCTCNISDISGICYKSDISSVVTGSLRSMLKTKSPTVEICGKFGVSDWKVWRISSEHHPFFTFLKVYRRVTRGGRGEVSPTLFQKLEKSALILGKNALIVSILG